MAKKKRKAAGEQDQGGSSIDFERALADVEDTELVTLLHDMMLDAELRAVALGSLSAYDHPETPSVILRHYGSFSPGEKGIAIETRASRPAYARHLVAAVQDGHIAVEEVPVHIARHLREFND